MVRKQKHRVGNKKHNNRRRNRDLHCGCTVHTVCLAIFLSYIRLSIYMFNFFIGLAFHFWLQFYLLVQRAKWCCTKGTRAESAYHMERVWRVNEALLRCGAVDFYCRFYLQRMTRSGKKKPPKKQTTTACQQLEIEITVIVLV